jgi:transposase
MLKTHQLAHAISDGGFAEFRRQLLDKAAWYGSRVAWASRWEPASKTGSACGGVDHGLKLSDRVFHCQNEACGPMLDRDLNAALNLSKLAGSSPASQNACGAVSAGCRRAAAVKLTPMKQEPNTCYSLAE